MKKFILFSFGFCSSLVIPNAYSKNITIFTVSLPQSGTNLLAKCVEDITQKLHTSSSNLLVIKSHTLKKLTHKQFYVTHAPCVPSNLKEFNTLKIKGIFIYRDPRDHIVSSAYWIKKHPTYWPHLKDHTIDELISKLIKEYNTVLPLPSFPQFNSISNVYKLYLPWQFQPFIYTTTFERLVGSHGGGSKRKQLKEIKNIACHLEIKLSTQQVEKIAEQLFGNTSTFRKGKIGSWKEHFTKQHKEDFKKIAGEILIELNYERDFNW